MQRNAKKSVEDLANKFREQVYYLVIPLLANGIKSQFNQKSLTPVELQAIYLMAMKVFFKLLFVAYAEYKDLLPHRSNAVYRKHSLKTIAEEKKLNLFFQADDSILKKELRLEDKNNIDMFAYLRNLKDNY